MDPTTMDGILKLSSVISYGEFEETLKEALTSTLPNVNDVVVYIPSQDGQNLVSTTGMLHTVPKDGILGECVNKRQRIIKEQGLLASDPVCGLLSTVPTKRKRVICSPVIDTERNNIVAVLLAICDVPSKEDLNNLSYLEKQTVVCCKRLRRTAQLHDGTSSDCTSIRDQAHLNNNNSILKLCADLYDHDAASLQIKVLKYLMEQTNSETGFILLIDPSHREMFCQVIGNRVLQEEIRFPLNDNTFTQCLETKSPITLADIEKGRQKKVEQTLGHKLHSLLCVPVMRKGSGEIMALACIANKHGANYSESDIEAVQYCFKYTATVLHSTLALQSERKLKNQTQALLQVAKNLFTHLDDLTVLLREIMQEARNLTKAERCSVFLVEIETQELVAKVFDGDVQDTNTEVRIPLNEGIAGHVATTGQILNIDDAYSHPLFYRGVDESTGFKTRNILCFPIKDENDKVIGVAQLCNKIKAAGFTSFDEDVAQAFSVYCCISIMHSLLYKKVRDAQHRSKLSNELMIYHMQIDPRNVTKFRAATIPAPTEIDPEFTQFVYTPRFLPYDKTPLGVLSMFEDMGFISKYRIQKETLVNFVLMVRRGYRDPPYHNWTHAFAVAHFCYIMHKNINLHNYVDDLDVFSLFVACLCHDIDHRGTTNSYQVASDSVLAALYSSEGSVLERHHFAQTMCILNTEGCNILENLGRSAYEKALDNIRDIILATDLAEHLRIIPELEKMAKNGYNRKDVHEQHLLLSLLMTSCDLSDQTKNWKVIKGVAELIYQEFFSQGDMEKELGKAPVAMMDRDKACIPELQIGFLDGIALPVFRLLAKLFPAAAQVLEVVDDNRRKWVHLNEKANELKLTNNSFDVLQIPIDSEGKKESSA